MKPAKNWVDPDIILAGESVNLIPLNENHFERLANLSREEKIWEFIPADMSTPAKVLKVLSCALDERDKGSQCPFVIFLKTHNKVIGSIRLMDIDAGHKKLEIGWTWLHPDYWATEVNPECKLLLLTYCFEKLDAIRVQLKTDQNNIRSRKAIKKIGGTFEGILRNDMIRADSTLRNSAYFSITDSDWPQVKPMLTELFKTKKHERTNS